MQLINISPGRFRELIRSHLGLSEILLIQLGKEGFQLADFKEAKITALIQGLKRKGYLEEDGSVTRKGEELYDSLLQPEESPLALGKLEKKDEEYKLWLAAFPPSDKWAYKGKKYPATRDLKSYKEDQKLKFLKILAEGEYTVDILIRALIAQVYAKLEESIRRGENKMIYFSNSEAYLNKKLYQNFIEEGKELTEQQVKEYYNIIKGKGGSESSGPSQTQKFL